MIIWQRRDVITEELCWKKENHRTVPGDTVTDIMMIRGVPMIFMLGDFAQRMRRQKERNMGRAYGKWKPGYRRICWII